MKNRAVVTAFCWLLVAAACTSGDESPGADGESTPPVAGVFDLSDDCKGFGRPGAPQLSFVAEGKLFVARPKQSTARCVLEVESAGDLEWGPGGDRLHFGDLRRYDGEQIFSLDDEPESLAWSRPTGESVVFITDRRLLKVSAFGDEPTDISFLADHDEVVYHPAGTHLAVTGTDDDGTYGVWLATNVGEEPQLLAVGEDALRIFSLSFEHGGATLYYAAEHDDRYDVHALHLALKDAGGSTRDAELDTLDSFSGEMADVVVSEFADRKVAYSVGTCDEGKKTRVWDGEVTELDGLPEGGSTEPVGWFPNGRLVVLVRDSGCTGDGTLYLWSPRETTELVAGVGAVGVRAVLPPPPSPPGSEQQVIA